MVQKQASLTEMVNQSKIVMLTPSVASFERYEQRGSLLNAAIYVGIAALIAGLLGLAGGLSGLIGGVLASLAQFFIFTGLVYYIGKSQGGTGTFDEVAYTFSLFIAPLIVIGAIVSLFGIIPLLGTLFVVIVSLLLLLVQAYFAYLAVQSSMNISNTGKSFLTLGGAVIGTFVIMFLISAIF